MDAGVELKVKDAALTDDEVVRRVLDGDIGLFEIIMRRYNQRLFRVARSVVKDDSEAEDIIQEAYVRAYEHLSQFEGLKGVQLNVRVTLGCPLADAEPIILPRLVNASNSQRHHLSKVFQGPPCS